MSHVCVIFMRPRSDCSLISHMCENFTILSAYTANKNQIPRPILRWYIRAGPGWGSRILYIECLRSFLNYIEMYSAVVNCELRSRDLTVCESHSAFWQERFSLDDFLRDRPL